MTQQRNTTSVDDSEKLKELFKKFDSLSTKNQIFFSTYLDNLISKIDLLDKQKDGGIFNPPMVVNEIQEIKYNVQFSVEHGRSGLTQLSKTEYAYQDALFKIQALFWATFKLSEMINSGHFKFNLEKSLNTLESLSQIGYSICESLDAQTLFEEFEKK